MANHAPADYALFSIDGLQAIEWMAADSPRLQAFFAAGPEDFNAVNGTPPRHDEAQQEFDERQRHGVPTGTPTSTLRCMAKPLAGGEWDAYFAQMPRDRPDSPVL